VRFGLWRTVASAGGHGYRNFREFGGSDQANTRSPRGKRQDEKSQENCVGRSIDNAEGDPAKQTKLIERAVGSERPQENR